MENFNSKHPEVKEGEVFLINAIEFQYKQMIWKTKRKGKVAYGRNGVALPSECFPVFVQKWELRKNGIVHSERLLQ